MDIQVISEWALVHSWESVETGHQRRMEIKRKEPFQSQAAFTKGQMFAGFYW